MIVGGRQIIFLQRMKISQNRIVALLSGHLSRNLYRSLKSGVRGKDEEKINKYSRSNPCSVRILSLTRTRL